MRVPTIESSPARGLGGGDLTRTAARLRLGDDSRRLCNRTGMAQASSTGERQMTQINPSVLIRNEGAEPIELHFRSQTVPLASQAA